MLLHQGTDILLNSVDAAINITNLKTISYVQIPTCCIAPIPTKLTDRCITTTPCILEVEIDGVTYIQNPQLVMMPTVHLKDEVEPVQIPLTVTVM